MSAKHSQQTFRARKGFRDKFSTFIAHIPFKRILRAGRLLGLLLYVVDARHRRIVRRNLTFVYPRWSAERINITSKRVFQNLGITILEIFQMFCFSKEKLIQKANIKGQELLLDAMAKNKGAIIITAHLGNWEIAPLISSLYFNTPVTVVARPLRNKLVHQWLHALRTRYGNRIIDKDGALPEMIRTLRQGKILGIVIDQETRLPGVEVTFFNKDVTGMPVAALLALRCKSPVLPAFCIRNADGTCTVNFKPPIPMQRTGDLRSDLRTNTQTMMDAIEKAVREHPEQWFWVHKRWKKYYPHLYKEDLEKKRRQREKERLRAQL